MWYFLIKCFTRCIKINKALNSFEKKQQKKQNNHIIILFIHTFKLEIITLFGNHMSKVTKNYFYAVLNWVHFAKSIGSFFEILSVVFIVCMPHMSISSLH